MREAGEKMFPVKALYNLASPSHPHLFESISSLLLEAVGMLPLQIILLHQTPLQRSE